MRQSAWKRSLLTPLLKAIARSARPNYDWYIAVETHRYQVWNIAVEAQRAWDDYIAYQNERIAQYDEIYAGFSHYLRGTDVKQNPFTGEMWELPDLYRHIWFSTDGRLLFTTLTATIPTVMLLLTVHGRGAIRSRIS